MDIYSGSRGTINHNIVLLLPVSISPSPSHICVYDLVCYVLGRLGERVAMTATVITPSGPVQVYNAHFELFCGMLDRIIIFTDFLNHARKMYATVPHQLIAGDFNTLVSECASSLESFDVMHVLY